MLLIVAILGVTYGWQSDGNQGVEYIIQIPPGQLAEIERTGEISSTIDPAVRGYVSKIIVKVGSGPLPRMTPPGFSRSASPLNSVALADHVAMPIPESGVSLPPAPTVATGTERRESMMKPQNGGPGLSLPPSLAPGFGGAVGQVTPPGQQPPGYPPRGHEEFNAAGGRPSDATQSTLGSSMGAPPRTDTAASNLQFTGDAELARPRVGGPSTEPVNSRDNAWQNPTQRWGATSGTAVAQQGGVAGHATLEGLPSPPTAADNRFSQGGAAPRPTSNFGQYPSGMTLPSNSPAAAAGVNLQNPQAGINDRSSVTQTGRPDTGSQRPVAAMENPFSRGHSEAPHAALTGQPSVNNFGATATQPPPAVARPAPAASGPSTSPPGTWSTNAYGQPLDNQGRVLDSWGRPIETVGSHPPTSPEAAGRFDQRGTIISGVPSPNVAPPNFADTRGLRPTVNPATAPSSPRSLSDANDDDGGRRFASQRPSEPGSEFESRAGGVEFGRSGGSEPRTGDRSDSRQSVTAQPLFNGLLLISIVANVYLIFWLKNLRHQFRDLVAAKRMAGSGATSS